MKSMFDTHHKAVYSIFTRILHYVMCGRLGIGDRKIHDVMCVRLGIGNVRCHVCETRNKKMHDVMCVRLEIGK